MKKTRSKRQSLLFIFLALLALMGLILLLLPKLFQLSRVQEKTSAFIERQFPGDIAYREERLSIFPIPRIHFYDVRLKVDDRLSATIHQVSATPHFFSLLRGRFNISKLTLSGVDATAGLPGKTGANLPGMSLAPLERQLETLADLLEPVRQRKFILEIADGTLTLTRGKNPEVSLQDIGGELTWRRPAISLDMTVGTDLWDRCRLMLDTDIVTKKISGRLTAEGLTPSPICDYIFPDAPIHLAEGDLDADISWETDNNGTWRLSVEAADPDITFVGDKTRYAVRGKKVAAEIRWDNAGIQASVSELDLDTPGLRLTGKFELNTDEPSAGWQVDVDNLDIASTRTAALFFAGRFKTTQKIAQVFQNGGVTRLTLGQKADTLNELKEVSTLHLQGRLENATVFVPEPDLLLTESYGTVSISDGTLKASDIETRLDNSTGSRGTFTMALTGENPWPWSVSCDVQADVAQLPPLLERLTKNSTLAREMAGIDNAEGSVTGTLQLDQGPDGFQVTVDTSKFNLSAVYHRIPFPVSLSGDRFYYQGRGLKLQGVKGNIGGSHLSDLDAKVTWETAPYLSISSARGEVAVSELTSWLGGALTECDAREDTATDLGRIHVAHLEFDGPVSTPSVWQFQTDGNVEKPFTVCMPLFPEALTVYKGNFTANHDRIDIDDADLLVQGSRFTAAGSLEGWLTEASPRILNARLEGSLDREASDWIYRHAGIPEILKWRTPISLTPLSLQWHETDGVTVSGEAAFDSGPRLSFSISNKSDASTVSSWVIQDAESQATLSMTRDQNSITARFSGDLHQKTASAMLADNQVLSGSLQGDVSTRFDTSPPFFKNMTGWLRASGLDLAPAGLPLQISQASMTGKAITADIDDARFAWKGTEFSATGLVARSEVGLLLNLDVATGHLDWPAVKALVSGETTTTPLLLGDVRFTCTRLNLTPALTFEPFGAHLKLGGDQTEIEFQQADACGISFPGTLTLMPGHMRFAFKPSATKQALEPTMACLKEGNAFIDGSFDLTGDIAFEWDQSISLMEAVEGGASMTAVDGRIYKGGFLGKLFSMLNVSEVLSGQFPDFEKEGFPYNTAHFEGKFKAGKFELETGVIDGPAMKLFFEGDEDFIEKKHALTIVVAPLKTVDAMVDKIPLLNDVLEKGLVVYPVKVTGEWEDPHLSVLSPTAVGGEVLGLMLRTLKAPVKLFEKIFQGNNDNKKD